jgi:serine/threonine protein phosphatase PrpC
MYIDIYIYIFMYVYTYIYPLILTALFFYIGQPASILSGGSLICNLPQHKVTAGCTAIVTLITENKLYVANAGDSRGVLCRKGGLAYPLSADHKPSQDRESARISAAGGFINHVGRINGNLNLSRSLGDLKYKQVEDIPPEEQVLTYTLTIINHVIITIIIIITIIVIITIITIIIIVKMIIIITIR